MHDNLQHLIDAGYICVREGVPQSPHIKELIKIANFIQDEFATRIVKRESWITHGDTDMEIESASDTPGLAAYLGTNYYVDLRRPKTEHEFKILIS